MTNVLGYGMRKGYPQLYRGALVEAKLLPKIQIDIVISKIPTQVLVNTVKKALYTGNVGDGKIFIYDVKTSSRSELVKKVTMRFRKKNNCMTRALI